jgi:penicillin amidase
MSYRRSGLLFPLIVLIILVFGLSIQMSNIPPLGQFLHPFTGVAHTGEAELPDKNRVLQLSGLKDSTRIFFDSRHVPHVFARNADDMYFAQGYITASLRLWQMDFMSYVSAGRLSEIFPTEEYLVYDRRQRRNGLLEAAKRSLHIMESHAETIAVLNAYTNGVNAFIEQLRYKDLPVEYKLFNYTPEPWTNLKSVLIMKYVASMLTGYEEDLSNSRAMLALGKEVYNKIYPDFYKGISPIVPDGDTLTTASVFNIDKPSYLTNWFLSKRTMLPQSTYNPRLGSNSWAVSGAKTKSGHPILCNDPHLGLTLPSIWLEMQLSSDKQDVYGVSIPGTPAVIIGFNESIAWGLTNGIQDVKDWYKLKLTVDYKQYQLDSQWHDLKVVVEEIKIKGQKSFYDSVYWSVHGPIVYDKNFIDDHLDQVNYSLSWELHNPSDEFLAFIKLNKAHDYDGFKQAIKYYSCPVQNFTFASKTNDIAIVHQGSIARKWPGQGRFILDGTLSSHLKRAYIPQDSLPQSLNPGTHYVFSANQHPTGPDYPYYYNGYFLDHRANRIRQLLDSAVGLDVQQMQLMQLDNVNSFAQQAMAILPDRIIGGKLNKEGYMALQGLKNWSCAYDSSTEHAELFNLWWNNITDYTWDEYKPQAFFSTAPKQLILLNMIVHDTLNAYFDNEQTVARESAQDIVTSAFIAAYNEFKSMKSNAPVTWGQLNRVDIMHLSYLTPFSKMNLTSAGYPDAINAVSKTWGPSWRMIVELGDRPRGYGVYPGGQSGIPGSQYYDNFITTWNKGSYYELTFFMNQREAEQSASFSWILK